MSKIFTSKFHFKHYGVLYEHQGGFEVHFQINNFKFDYFPQRMAYLKSKQTNGLEWDVILKLIPYRC